MMDVSNKNAIELSKHVNTNLFDAYGGVVVKNLFFKNCTVDSSDFGLFSRLIFILLI